ncbi:MAG: S8 family serine peptidase [Verrucomicrobiales bacterium]|nr:S8 family serine peptidase [Verrucomicrobiales bacterium]
MNDKTTAATIAAAAIALVVALIFILKGMFSGFLSFGSDESASDRTFAGAGPTFELRPQAEIAPEQATENDPLNDLDPAFVRKILDFFLSSASSRDALPGEAILRFKNSQAYRDFLATAKSKGIKVLGRLDPLNAVRVSFDKLGDLRRNLEGIAEDLSAVEGNYLVTVPDIPLATDERSSGGSAAGFGASILEHLGISGQNSAFGSGIRVAVLDSGISAHPTFDSSKVRTFDLIDPQFTGATTTDSLGHGTAVASLIAGTNPQAAGVAPAVDLLSYRVTDADGNSDSFTLAQGIINATDAGAKLINISLGSYGDSPVILEAINYATSQNSLVIAAAGNEQLVDAAYPARYPGVVSVGGTDANNQQLSFSNASPTLDFGAPGYEINAADLDSNLVQFTGTSASTPIVTGAIAAVMSELSITDPYQALDLLQSTANEAGAPGEDAAYGHGVIDIQRALTSNSRGIVDSAVASHYYDADNTFGYGPNQMLFVVENRGTEPLANLPISINANGTQINHAFPSILPNGIGVYPVPIDLNNLNTQGAQSFQSRVLFPNQSDARDANNALSTSLIAPEAP